jgi:NADH-quinone oxidoreductase subunit F
MPQEYRLVLKNADAPGYTPDIDCYLRHGGYEVLKKALTFPPKTLADGKALTAQEQIREDVKLSGLRGRGGAGFSCGLKWSFVDRRSGKPVYLICNADESEPGTFKDRQIIHKDPHQLLEGMIISCFANDVHLAYIYIRGEFPEGARILNRALNEARAKNFLGKNILGSGYDLEIYVHRGAGAYICGEETGLIESLEGKRPYPRIKPPYFPAVLGLWMCPTIVNNVETLCHVKHIVAMGAAEYAKLGTLNNNGTRIVSLSGHVRRPGYYEIEVGKVSMGELIFHENFGGGLRDGRKLKAVIPGGSSAKVLKAGEKFKLKKKGSDGKEIEQEVDMLDLPYDFDSLAAAGTMSGSSAIIVMDDSTDIVEALHNISEFYAHESCGQCTPCREGSLWMAKALHRLTHGQGRRQDADYLIKIADNIPGGRTICAFGEACSWPVQSFVGKFKDEFIAKGAEAEARRGGAGTTSDIVNQFPGFSASPRVRDSANV